jgi:hypothetical protein
VLVTEKEVAILAERAESIVLPRARYSDQRRIKARDERTATRSCQRLEILGYYAIIDGNGGGF